MMEIRQLKPTDYKNKKLKVSYYTTGYYAITRSEIGFEINYVSFENPIEKSFEDVFFSDWLEDPLGFGAFENDQMIGYVEGSLEAWNNRFRISNLCVFDSQKRNQGLGSQLMVKIVEEAKKTKARMIVLETQSCNEKAIAFYKKHGFEIIGFDLYAYSNDDPKLHEVRIEMGKKL